jgi:galactoside O-acetyltransferase
MNPFDPGYYTEDDLKDAGFKSVGRNVRIARNNTIVGLGNIEIGDHVRIDGYCLIVAAGRLSIGSHVHVAGYCYLSAGAGMTLADFTAVSHGSRLYTQSDDYTGQYLTNPTVPARYTGVARGAIVLERHALVGSGTVILPGVTIGEGSSVGALSLVTKSLAPWGVYFGSPVRRLKGRSRRLLELEAELRAEEASGDAPA